jgi:hypothetical protein
MGESDTKMSEGCLTKTVDGLSSFFNVNHGVEEEGEEWIKILVADGVNAGLHALIGGGSSLLLQVVQHGLDGGNQQNHVVAHELGQSSRNVSDEVQSRNLGLELGGSERLREGREESEERRTVAEHLTEGGDGVLGSNLNFALLVTEGLQDEGKLRGKNGFG